MTTNKKNIFLLETTRNSLPINKRKLSVQKLKAMQKHIKILNGTGIIMCWKKIDLFLIDWN